MKTSARMSLRLIETIALLVLMISVFGASGFATPEFRGAEQAMTPKEQEPIFAEAIDVPLETPTRLHRIHESHLRQRSSNK